MRNLPENTQGTGMFQLSDQRRLPGTLSLDGENTTLHLWNETGVLGDELDDKTITGVLGDQKQVTLIDCILNSCKTSIGLGSTASHYYIFPNYVIVGDRLIFEDCADIENISYVFEDAPTLFRDMESFRVEFCNAKETSSIIEALRPDKKAHIGQNACVAYYTGKEEIFCSDSELGYISVRHSPTFNFGGPQGIRIDNKIVTKIEFSELLCFQDAVSRVYRSVSFFELIVGRVQNLKEISISWKGGEQPIRCDVYPTMYPRYEQSTGEAGSSVRDILVDGARDPSVLSRIATEWLIRDASWRTARAMLLSGWRENRSYSADRLVRAANMYDLLPDTCFPDVPQVDGDLASAVQKAKKMFQELPEGIDRNSVLGTLGRVGTLTLKTKIRFRVAVLSQLIGERIPNIDRVAEEAVNLRNRYVHGTATRIDYSDNPALEIFLTDTLEFVFAASDLVDAGWNICDWIKRGSHTRHPFGSFLESYPENWSKLKRLIDEM